MSKKHSFFIALIVIIVSFIALPYNAAFANIADGTYKVNYEMKESGSNNTSISDGYFTKPATVTVKSGVKTVQLTVTSADMIKSLSGPNGPVTVISDNGDSRTVSFTVNGDLSQPVTLGMHIVVPDMYDMEHSARAVFDVSDLPSAGAGEKSTSTDDTNESTNEGAGKAEDNPPTGDDTSIALYVSLLIGSAVAFFAVRKLRLARD